MEKKIEIKFSFEEVKTCLLDLLTRRGENIDDEFRENAKMCVDNGVIVLSYENY